MNRKRFDRLMKRLSTGELTDAERRELHELAAGDGALRAEVAQTEALLAAARESRVEQPSDFEWAAFSTRLEATIEAERPRPYGRFRLWLEALGGEFQTRRLAVATSTVAAVAIGVLLVVNALRPTAEQSVTLEFADAGPEWRLEEFEQHYELTDVLPAAGLLALELELEAELDEVRKVIETAPLDGAEGAPSNGADEEILNEILGQGA